PFVIFVRLRLPSDSLGRIYTPRPTPADGAKRWRWGISAAPLGVRDARLILVDMNRRILVGELTTAWGCGGGDWGWR
ncbi:hypothetical protein, partial [Achromobacter sp. DH1f]|uniref:hypothetical protein n=1 Tax=Achromobacter sp. DH1f TaxID=1397275 RepID=UPI001E54F243